MAVVIFKSPCVGPGSVYYFATPPGETKSIPDAHVAELDPKCLIVIEASSEVKPTPAPTPGTLLRELDWLRAASAEEVAEVKKLRQPDPEPEPTPEPEPKPVVTRRRSTS